MKTARQNSSSQRIKRDQPRKDSKSKRVNFDNTRADRVSKAIKDCNDVSWYAKSPQLLEAAASLPTSRTSGHNISQYFPFAVPGVYSMYWTPVFEGPATQAAMNSIYSFVVHANSRNDSYDAPDMFYMILAGAQVFAAISLAERAYGLARNYSQENAYKPDYLIAAMGLDPEDFRSNLSQVWFDINQLIAQSQQIWIPNDLPIIEREFWLNSHVYKDAEGDKAQFYMFTQEFYYKLSETGSSAGTSLVRANATASSTAAILENSRWSWSTFKSMISDMINALVSSQDRGVIFGDILKAYGKDRIYALSPIPADYVTPIVYNAEVLTQIENATIVPAAPVAMTQNPFGEIYPIYPLLTANQTETFSAFACPDSVLNFHFPTPPTPADIMVATRLKTSGLRVTGVNNSGSTVTYSIGPNIHGTEFLTAAIVLWVDRSTGDASNIRITIPGNISWLGTAAGDATNSSIFYAWSACDWAPILYASSVPITTPNATGDILTRSKVEWIYCDFDNYTTVEATVLDKMHTTAIYSLLGVPTI